MTSQIIFEKQHQPSRNSFNQSTAPFISEHTTPQPEGDEETAVTPRKKKAVKRQNKRRQIGRKGMPSKKAKGKEKPEKTNV